jgi:hypothetical protein
LLLWFLVSLVVALRRRLDLVPGITAAGSGVTLLCVWAMVSVAAPNRVIKPLALYIRPGLAHGGRVIVYDTAPTCSIDVYTGARFMLIGDPNELRFGAEHLPSAQRKLWFGDGIGVLRAEMSRPEPVYCFVDDHKKAADTVGQLGGLARELAWNGKRSVLGNRAAQRWTPYIGVLPASH